MSAYVWSNLDKKTFCGLISFVVFKSKDCIKFESLYVMCRIASSTGGQRLYWYGRRGEESQKSDSFQVTFSLTCTE